MTLHTGRPAPNPLTPGSRTCQCMACGRFFKSPTSFFKHRTDDPERIRRCLTPEEMQALGMSRNDLGQWITKAYEREG